MLLRSMWVKAVNPEHRIIDAIANPIGRLVFGKFSDAAEPSAPNAAS
jgi:hypothetical protein